MEQSGSPFTEAALEEAWDHPSEHQAKDMNHSEVSDPWSGRRCDRKSATKKSRSCKRDPRQGYYTWLSSPRNRSMMKKRQDHSWDKGIIVTALGKAMKASPGPAGHTTQLSGLQTTRYLKRNPLLSTMSTQECVGTSVSILTCL